jgi:uncharacterized protein (DUF736 family)
MIIGKFTLQGDYTGQIAGFGLTVSGVTIRPVAQKTKLGPEFIVTADNGAEIGTAWKRIHSKTRKPYLGVKLDGPTLIEPIYCGLIRESNGAYLLVWNRRDEEPSTDVIT